MEWKSAITYVEKNKIVVRGYRQEELIGNVPFSHAVFLLWQGRLPNKREGEMMDALLTAVIDHGPSAPTALSARVVATAGVPLSTAVSAGVMAVGDVHGGAIEASAKFFQECVRTAKTEGQDLADVAKRQVLQARREKRRIPGFGHRLHTRDPRTVKLFQIAEDLKIAGEHVSFAVLVANFLSEALGREIPINVDGAIAAIISDMGFDYRMGKAFFIMGRTAGIIAHVYEEMTREKPMRDICPRDYVYDGPKEQKISKALHGESKQA